MSRRPSSAWYAVAAVGLLALWAWKTGYLFPEPTLDPNPVAYRRGEEVARARCMNCHTDIPLAPRVAGWTPEYAYDAVGQLPQLQPAMPPFKGTEQERADLAVYLSILGGTEEAHAEAATLSQPGWAPPRSGPRGAPAAGAPQEGRR